MKSLQLLLVICSTILLFACAKDGSLQEEEKVLESEITLSYGETHSIPNENSSISFIDVNEYRCPSDLTCIWAGNAEVKMRLRDESKQISHFFTLNTHQNFRNDTIINDIELKLLKLNPYPVSTKEIFLEDYEPELLIRQ